MPSGHGGGGGGSHFSGGSHYSGSSNSYHRPATPIVFGHGRYYMHKRYASRYNSLLGLFGAVLLIFVGIVMCFLAELSTKNTIEKDHDRYVNMIEYALEDTSYQRKGYLTSLVYNDEVDKYFYTYTIKTDNGDDLEGYTYSIYSKEEADNFYLNMEIMFAVDANPVTLTTDSINLDYINKPLEDDGEYIQSISTLNTFKIVMIVSSIIAAILLGISLLYKYKHKKERQVNNTSPKEDKDHGMKRCPYCNSSIPIESKTCEYCGGDV